MNILTGWVWIEKANTGTFCCQCNRPATSFWLIICLIPQSMNFCKAHLEAHKRKAQYTG